MKISLVLSSSDQVAQQPTPYTVNGVTITPNDRRLRRVFSSVLYLRNRLPTNNS
ncbi:PilW family protein [Methylocucumis oryzae]|uniref:PilW family protein n=1 Tax=Methylocucumis oryzae TaxID=1632867 RepID=UPI0034DE29C5